MPTPKTNLKTATKTESHGTDGTNAIEVTPEMALLVLRGVHPGGFRVDRDGKVVTEELAAVKIGSMEELAARARKTRTVKALLNGDLIEFTVRGLSADQQSEVEKLTDELHAPQKFKQEGGKRVADGYDFEDVEYNRKLKPLVKQKVALTICYGLADLAVPGQTLEERSDWLQKHLTPQVINVLYSAIVESTSDPLRMASFT